MSKRTEMFLAQWLEVVGRFILSPLRLLLGWSLVVIGGLTRHLGFIVLGKEHEPEEESYDRWR